MPQMARKRLKDNDKQKISLIDNSSSEFVDLQNDINAPIQILDDLSCYINNYNQINKDQLEILLKTYKKVIIDYFKFKLIIENNKYFIKFNNLTKNF